MRTYGTWEDVCRDDFERDGFQLKVGMEMAVRIRNLSYECMKSPAAMPGRDGIPFDEAMWRNGLTELLGYKLPRLHYGQAYKLVIV